jgi:hypothetical protein
LRTAAEAVAAPIASAVRVIAARRVMPWRPVLNMVMLNSELDDGAVLRSSRPRSPEGAPSSCRIGREYVIFRGNERVARVAALSVVALRRLVG